jgi:hypothetical protein
MRTTAGRLRIPSALRHIWALPRSSRADPWPDGRDMRRKVRRGSPDSEQNCSSPRGSCQAKARILAQHAFSASPDKFPNLRPKIPEPSGGPDTWGRASCVESSIRRGSISSLACPNSSYEHHRNRFRPSNDCFALPMPGPIPVAPMAGLIRQAAQPNLSGRRTPCPTYLFCSRQKLMA